MPELSARLRIQEREDMASQPKNGQWLLDSGLKKLELLFRAIVYQPAEPILIADNDRNYWDASCGAGKLFGLPRNRIIGRRIDDFAEPSFRPQIEQLWRAFLEQTAGHVPVGKLRRESCRKHIILKTAASTSLY